MPKIPEGVKKGLMQDLAATKKGKPGACIKLAAHWGLTAKAVTEFGASNRQEIDDLRGKVAEACIGIAAQTLGEISKDLADADKMAETPLRDKAMTVDKLVNAAAVAKDGHKPLISMDFGKLLSLKDSITARDLSALREAKKRPA